MSVTGKVILITGAARGLGFEYARALGQAGAHIVAAMSRTVPMPSQQRETARSVCNSTSRTSPPCEPMAERAIERLAGSTG